jgi:hypothetical protein
MISFRSEPKNDDGQDDERGNRAVAQTDKKRHRGSISATRVWAGQATIAARSRGRAPPAASGSSLPGAKVTPIFPRPGATSTGVMGSGMGLTGTDHVHLRSWGKTGAVAARFHLPSFRRVDQFAREGR